MSNFTPFIYNCQSLKTNILNPDKKTNLIIYSKKEIDNPIFKTGFNYYIQKTKIKMVSIYKTYQDKKKIYRILNNFEPIIDSYDETIKNELEKKLNITIISRDFYKIWEILYYFDEEIKKFDKFISISLSDNGASAEAILNFRQKETKNNKDKYMIYTLSDDDDNYLQIKPQKNNINKIIDISAIKYDHKADLITATGGTNWNNIKYQEQEIYRLLFAEIFNTIKLQNDGGMFICKFFDMYNKTTIKFLLILQSFYKHIYIVKPLISRVSNSERFIICINFKMNDKYFLILSKLYNNLHSNLKLNILDIFADFIIDNTIYDEIYKINNIIGINNYILINNMAEYIEKNNYFGETFHKNYDIQIEASKFWIEKFINKNTNDIFNISKL